MRNRCGSSLFPPRRRASSFLQMFLGGSGGSCRLGQEQDVVQERDGDGRELENFQEYISSARGRRVKRKTVPVTQISWHRRRRRPDCAFFSSSLLAWRTVEEELASLFFPERTERRKSLDSRKKIVERGWCLQYRLEALRAGGVNSSFLGAGRLTQRKEEEGEAAVLLLQ